jgi:hypothetical protein
MDGSRGSGSLAAEARPVFHRSRLELAIAPSAVRIARHWTAYQLTRKDRPGLAGCQEPLDSDVADSAVLVVSELVTNAIRAVRQLTGTGMILPGRVLSFGDRMAFAGVPPRQERLSMFAGRTATAASATSAASTAPAAAAAPAAAVLTPVPASVSLVISRFSGVVRIDVHDSSPVPLPPGCRRDADDETGRGLTVVAALAERWGWQPGPFGKVVWCELSATPGDAGVGAGG